MNNIDLYYKKIIDRIYIKFKFPHARRLTLMLKDMQRKKLLVKFSTNIGQYYIFPSIGTGISTYW